LQLFNKTIPYSKTNKFLGLYFDKSICFDKQIKEVKTKCMNRLNIIKILSSKNLKLNHNKLASLYKALIGSILDYNFPCLNLFSESVKLTTDYAISKKITFERMLEQKTNK
ncbi:RNA-directed DNA polymerase from mobile element jockey-like, partial [Brachionus plicatilis]